MFVTVHSDSLLLQIFIPVIGVSICLFACFLTATAADITAKSEKMHGILCDAAARHSFAYLLSAKERQFLLLMMEHASSERNSFALTTMDGQKYTMESFVAFLIETGLQYTLLFTFNRGYAFQ